MELGRRAPGVQPAEQLRFGRDSIALAGYTGPVGHHERVLRAAGERDAKCQRVGSRLSARGDRQRNDGPDRTRGAGRERVEHRRDADRAGQITRFASLPVLRVVTVAFFASARASPALRWKSDS